MQNKLTNIKKEINDNKIKGIKPKLSHTRKRRSVVWSKGAFKEKPGDESKVICEQCALQGKAHEYGTCKDSTTTSLRRHLEAKHPRFWKKINTVAGAKQPKVSKYLNSKPDWKQKGKKSQKVDHDLVRLVIAFSLPLYIVDSPELKKLLHPEYIQPSATYFTKLLKSKYVQLKAILYNKVQKYNYVGVQVDHYTASNKYPYCNASLSYVDEDYNLKTINLETFGYKLSHTAEDLFKSMEGTGGIIEKAN